MSAALWTAFDGPSALIPGSAPFTLLIADTGNNRVRLFREQTSDVVPWFGSGVCKPATRATLDVPLLSANLCSPTSLAEDGNGIVWVIDGANRALWRVDPAADAARVVLVDGRLTTAARLAAAPHPSVGGAWRVLVGTPGEILQYDNTMKPRCRR